MQFERYIADFIQKQRSLVRQLESSNLLSYGAGERAPLVAKQLAFEKAQEGWRRNSPLQTRDPCEGSGCELRERSSLCRYPSHPG